nr:MAG TPA: hypothetical protein [Caudoviricetes sp.]
MPRFKTIGEVRNFLNLCGREFCNNAAVYTQNQIKKYIQSGLYNRSASKYYDRTGTVLTAIKISNLSYTGASRPRVSRSVEFDYTKLRLRKKSIINRNGSTQVMFGAHMSLWDKDNRRWMPKSIEDGWSTFAGYGKRKFIPGTHAFAKTKIDVKRLMTAQGVKGWISGGVGNIKLQKVR